MTSIRKKTWIKLSIFVATLTVIPVAMAASPPPGSPGAPATLPDCSCPALRSVQSEAEAGLTTVSQNINKSLMPDPQIETSLSGCLSGLARFSLGSMFSFGLPSLNSIISSVCSRFTDRINAFVESNMTRLVGSGTFGVTGMGGLFTAEFGTGVTGDDPNVFINNPAITTTDTSDVAVDAIWKSVDDENLKKKLKEAKGIGTPATRAGVIAGLLKQKQLDKKGKNLIPTQEGMEIYDILKSTVPELLDAARTA